MTPALERYCLAAAGVLAVAVAAWIVYSSWSASGIPDAIEAAAVDDDDDCADPSEDAP